MYYLNPTIQFLYNLGMRSNLLFALRNVIYRSLSNTTNTTDTIMEGRSFKKIIGSFSDGVAISYHYKMDSSKRKLHTC